MAATGSDRHEPAPGAAGDTAPDRPTDPPGGRAARRAAWLLYTLIVFEILFMVSPLAAYYYAVYGVPLNALAERPATAWLTQQMLPHFSYSDSVLVNGLISVSWPLILTGLALFLVGFGQIYYARFTGRGAVSGGLYRWIRHPQYVALALVGLGTTLFWSRFLVVIAFVTMLCLYVALARAEERSCQRRFGAAYQAYLAATGRFLPRRLEAGLGRLLPAPPAGATARVTLGVITSLLLIVASVWLGARLREHAVASLQVSEIDGHGVLFLAPWDAEARAAAAAMLSGRLGATPRLVYVAPLSWSIPELGLVASGTYPHGSAAELTHPTTHGNAGGYLGGPLRVLVTAPMPAAGSGRDLLAAAIRAQPLEVMHLDPANGHLSERTAAGPSRWAGVPVPLF